MPVLQRSCRACAGAKRQCDLTVPRCRRCLSRNIPCKYINQPGASESSVRRTSRRRPRSQELGALERALDSFQLVVGRRLQIYDPFRLEVIRTFDAATIQQQIGILKSLPIVYARCGANAFIHRNLYSTQLPPHLSDISLIINASYGIEAESLPNIPTPQALKSKVRQLLLTGARAKSYEELVSCVQALILMQITRLFQNDPESDDPERDNGAIWTLSHKLWEQAPIQLPSSLSPWRAWVFAESVRRTLLVCNILIGVYGVLRRGYAVHALCIEALPFDMRTELWDSSTEDSWKEAACANGENLPLVSFRQFKSLQRSASDRSPFETLLRLSFKDSGENEAGATCPMPS